MELPKQIAAHIRNVHFGGNWTSVDLRDTLKDVTWQQATKQLKSLNTIATLVYHINYYIRAVTKVLEGGPLDASDKLSFDNPQFQSADEWEMFKASLWVDAEKFAALIEVLPEPVMWQPFAGDKYGTYYANLQGIIEHFHYHLGQITIIKKLLSETHQ
jgi:uncharacterized damage-inducible protein DinB